jgi:hypothetical protein
MISNVAVDFKRGPGAYNIAEKEDMSFLKKIGNAIEDAAKWGANNLTAGVRAGIDVFNGPDRGMPRIGGKYNSKNLEKAHKVVDKMGKVGFSIASVMAGGLVANKAGGIKPGNFNNILPGTVPGTNKTVGTISANGIYLLLLGLAVYFILKK